MNWIEMIGLLITGIIVPYVVQLIKTEAITGSKARLLTTVISIAAGLVVFFAAGVPHTPYDLIVCLFAAGGAVQFAYSAFKAVGVTNEWLEALGAINAKAQDTPDIIAKNQALRDKAEDRASKDE